jgi:hypothetical protein
MKSRFFSVSYFLINIDGMYHGCYDPLSYPLFFPRGEFGWHNCIPKVGVTEAQVNRARAIRKQRAQGVAMMK